MENIKDIIPQVIERLSKEGPPQERKLRAVWQGAFQRQELKHMRLVGIKGGRLLVYVDSSAWLYQMRLKKPQLLQALQQHTQEIQDIHFQIGKVV